MADECPQPSHHESEPIEIGGSIARVAPNSCEKTIKAHAQLFWIIRGLNSRHWQPLSACTFLRLRKCDADKLTMRKGEQFAMAEMLIRSGFGNKTINRLVALLSAPVGHT